uniref:Uncharacterized protein n=1 Tax=Zooxanthella nutricula TaxID=1333877 RepID=A0A7S2IW21_9DINO
MSDGGADFTGLCKFENCTFQLCPPANDRWHPWPFFRRFYDAARSLGTEFVVMLEPDNTVHGPITRPPPADAGGLYVPSRSFGLREYVEQLAAQRAPGFAWTKKAMQAGLAGGSYFRTAAVLDAFSDEAVAKIDWNYVAERVTKEVFSSDFAMQYALAARGWHIEAWEDSAQMSRDPDMPSAGPKDAAFRHYCACYPGGKPTYKLHLAREDKALVAEPPKVYSQTNSVCQLCYNHSRYVELWGSSMCTSAIPFSYSALLMKRYHPELQDGCRKFLPWLCKYDPG